MKKEDFKIKKRDKVITEYFAVCNSCGVEITGRGIKHIELNIEQHIEKHNKNKEKRK